VTDLYFKNIHKYPPTESPEMRDEKIERCNLRAIKAHVNAGSYHVSAVDVADKILSAQLFLFTPSC